MTPSLAFFVSSELVLTFIPFITGIAHEATGCNYYDVLVGLFYLEEDKHVLSLLDDWASST